MPGRYADWVKETTATTGTGTWTLAGAVTPGPWIPFSTAFPNTTSVVAYSASDGTNWETGIGLYTLSGTTLQRLLVTSSSNSGALVNFPGPTTTVACAKLAETEWDNSYAAAFASHQYPSN